MTERKGRLVEPPFLFRLIAGLLLGARSSIVSACSKDPRAPDQTTHSLADIMVECPYSDECEERGMASAATAWGL